MKGASGLSYLGPGWALVAAHVGRPSGEGCEAGTTFMEAGGILEQHYPNRSEFCSFK